MVTGQFLTGVRATVSGNTGAESELRYLANGMPVCRVSVGCYGTEKVPTEWYNLHFFGEAAEFVNKMIVDKGFRVIACGRLRVKQYNGKNGAGVSRDLDFIKELWVGEKYQALQEIDLKALKGNGVEESEDGGEQGEKPGKQSASKAT